MVLRTLYGMVLQSVFLILVFLFSINYSYSFPSSIRSLKIYFIHTGEKEEVVYKRNGRFDVRGLHRINVLLRDWRQNKPTRMDPNLLDLLWEAYRKSGSRSYIHVVSAYRSPATNSMLRTRTSGVAKNSQHMLGKAIDFYFPDVNVRTLRNIVLKMQGGGVGYYPSAGYPFIHLDVGRVRHWPGMNRSELIAMFPQGKTLHIPKDGKPLPGYQEAMASYRIRSQKNQHAVLLAYKEQRSSFKNLLTAFFPHKNTPTKNTKNVLVASYQKRHKEKPFYKNAVIADSAIAREIKRHSVDIDFIEDLDYAASLPRFVSLNLSIDQREEKEEDKTLLPFVIPVAKIFVQGEYLVEQAEETKKEILVASLLPEEAPVPENSFFKGHFVTETKRGFSHVVAVVLPADSVAVGNHIAKSIWNRAPLFHKDQQSETISYRKQKSKHKHPSSTIYNVDPSILSGVAAFAKEKVLHEKDVFSTILPKEDPKNIPYSINFKGSFVHKENSVMKKKEASSKKLKRLPMRMGLKTTSFSSVSRPSLSYVDDALIHLNPSIQSSHPIKYMALFFPSKKIYHLNMQKIDSFKETKHFKGRAVDFFPIVSFQDLP